MSLSNRPLRLALIGFSLVSALALGACSGFTPVYSGALAAQPSLQLAYAEPNSRLEQIIYQELALRLGKTEDGTAPLVRVSLSTSGIEVADSVTVNPRKPLEVTIRAILTVSPRDGGDAAVLTLTRQATASYTRSGQVLADRLAADEAAERAAKAAAESLRLALLADLARG